MDEQLDGLVGRFSGICVLRQTQLCVTEIGICLCQTRLIVDGFCGLDRTFAERNGLLGSGAEEQPGQPVAGIDVLRRIGIQFPQLFFQLQCTGGLIGLRS